MANAPVDSAATSARRSAAEVDAFFGATYEPAPESTVYDAVYEDLDTPDVPSEPLADATSAWQAVSGDEPEALDAPAVQMGDPYAQSTDPTGEGRPFANGPVIDTLTGGFQIGFDTQEPQTTALAPIRPSLPVIAPQTAPAIPPPPAPPRVQARMAMRDKAEALFRYRRIALGIFLASLLLALTYSLLAPKEYESYSVVLINTTRPAEGADSIVGDFVDVPGLEGRKVLNQALILQQAPAIAERTARRLISSAGGSASLSFVDNIEGEVNAQSIATYIQEKVVSVKPAGEEVDAIRVTAKTGNAEEAARIAELYTEEYAALTRETSRERITATREFLEAQVARRQGELDEIERQISNYMRVEGAVALDAQTQGAISQIATLQASLDRARIETRMREATLRSLESEMMAMQPRLAIRTASTAEGEIRQLDTQITELERVIEQIYLRNPEMRGNPDAHPDLATLETRLRRMQAEKRTLAAQFAGEVAAAGGIDLSSTGSNGQGYIADLRRQMAMERASLDGSRAESGALSGRLAEASGVLVTIPEQARELAQLQRSRAATEQLHLFLNNKLQAASVAEETEFGLAQVVREPQVPSKPTSPNLMLNLLLGGMLGLLLGMAATAVRFRTDAYIHTPNDLADVGLTLVGTVPDLGDDADGMPVTVNGMSVSSALIALAKPFSPAAESFRHLHAALQGGADAPQVLLVTSPEIGSGKSLVAANLAVAAAQADRRVLLIDADLRRPQVHAYLGLGAAPALGTGVEAENLVYWNTVVPGLFALTALEPAQGPQDLWSPERSAKLIAGLRSTFDLIVIDAPPGLLAADAAVIAPHCDAALLIASANDTHADALTQVATELSRAGLSQIGAVLNRFKPAQTVGFRRTFGYRYAMRYAADRPSESAPAPKPTARTEA